MELHNVVIVTKDDSVVNIDGLVSETVNGVPFFANKALGIYVITAETLDAGIRKRVLKAVEEALS